MKHALAAVVAAAALASVALVARPRPHAAPTVARAQALAPAPARSDTRRYAVALRNETDFAARASGGSDAMAVRVTGSLAVSPVERAGGSAVLVYALSSPRLELTQAGRDALTPATRALLEAALAEPFYVERRSDGSAVSVRTTRDLDPMAAGVQRYLAASMQLTRGSGERWTAREIDATGRCDADYRRVAERTYERTRGGWVRLDARGNPATGGPRVRVEGTSRARLQLDAAGEIESVEGDDTQRTAGADGLDARATSHLSVRRAPDGDGLTAAARAAHAARWRSLRPARLDEAPESPAMEATRDRRLVAGATLATLREMIPATLEGEGQGAAAARAQQRVAALLRLDAGAADEAGRALRSRVTAGEAAVLIAALGDAGTPRAQAALADVVGDARVAAPVRERAVVALGMVERPTAEAVDALRRAGTTGDDGALREAATLALGAAGNAAGHAGTPEAGVAFEALAARAAAARDEGELALVLEAVGNTGDARALALAEPFTRHPSRAVREAAVGAVRFVASAEADAWVAAKLAARDDEALRVGAVRAAGFRALEPLGDALAALLATDPSQAVRARTVSMLGGRVRQSPMAAELLLRAAESDPDGDVRAAAHEWLRQLDGA